MNNQPIPKPKVVIYRAEELRLAMQMGADEFSVFCSMSRILASQFLDINILYRRQEAESRRQFTESLITELPTLKGGYEASWPVDIYMKQYLQHRVYASRFQKKQRGRMIKQMGSKSERLARSSAMPLRKSKWANRVLSEALDEPTLPLESAPTLPPKPSSSKPRRFVVLVPRLASVLKQVTNQLHRDGTPVTASTHIERSSAFPEPAPSDETPMTTNTLVERSSALPEPAPSDEPPVVDELEDVIRVFLRTLKPSMENLMDGFHDVGIKSFADFKALLAWPEADRNEFLSVEFGGRLSNFQLTALQNGCMQWDKA